MKKEFKKALSLMLWPWVVIIAIVIAITNDIPLPSGGVIDPLITGLTMLSIIGFIMLLVATFKWLRDRK